MELVVNKSTLPKGLSYVLKTSQLVDVLEPLNIDQHIHLNYHSSRAGEMGINIFECLYWLPNFNVPYSRFYITIGTVNKAEKKNAADLFVATAIEQFLEWVKYMASLPANSTLLKHNSYFKVIFKDGVITIVNDPKISQ
jgi:hypothetical protein